MGRVGGGGQPGVTRAIQSTQIQVERQNFELRKSVLDYDEVLNQQRTVIYAARRHILEGHDLDEQVTHMINEVVTAYVHVATVGRRIKDWDLDTLWVALRSLYPVGIQSDSLALH